MNSLYDLTNGYTDPTAAAVSTTAAPVSSTAAGIYGLIGASAGTLANSYLDALGKKLAGVGTTQATTAPAVTDSTKSTAVAATNSAFSSPIVIGGIAAVLGIGLILALRRN